MCASLWNFEVLIVIIKKLDNGRKESTNHLVIYALKEGEFRGGLLFMAYTRRLRTKEVPFSGFRY